MIFTCRDIELSFGATRVLKNVSFTISAKEKVALVGVNGAGKTSLFKVVLGELTADSGEVSIARGAKVGYLSQNMDLDVQKTIIEELNSVFAHLDRLDEAARALEADMGTQAGAELERSMARYAKLTGEFEDAGGYAYKSR
ncbi:MAG: ATP-binding cassette domain-containing protein, partial [Defluviitaleaceae bacterium]|nr:ATP-binding cassette domain-containing protein [Defluviitaleaceae bacterium]